VLGEFLVTVAGVTVALAGDSFWTARQERAAEAEYLSQLQSGLRENVSLLESAIELEGMQRGGAQRAAEAVAKPEPIPLDSATAWLVERRGGFYSDPRLITGTIATMLATGDIRLIRNSQLRQAVVAYETQIREDRTEFDRHVERGYTSVSELFRIGSAVESGSDAPDGVRPYSVLLALTSAPGPQVLYHLEQLALASANRTTYLRRMLDATRELLDQLAVS
jgi:hypothetical protein